MNAILWLTGERVNNQYCITKRKVNTLNCSFPGIYRKRFIYILLTPFVSYVIVTLTFHVNWSTLKIIKEVACWRLLNISRTWYNLSTILNKKKSEVKDHTIILKNTGIRYANKIQSLRIWLNFRYLL